MTACDATGQGARGSQTPPGTGVDHPNCHASSPAACNVQVSPVPHGGPYALDVTPTVEPWFAVQVKPNCGGIALRNLARQGFAIFAPTVEVTRRHRDAFRTSWVPLFPGYVFVSVGDHGSRWRSINSTYGVSRIVSFGGTPAPLPVEFVDALMARCDAGGRVRPEAEGHDMAVGDNVRILLGPLASLVGQIVKLPSEQRVVLLLDLLGGKTRVVVPVENLAKVL